MFKIIFKGDLEPLYLSQLEGEQLQRDLESGELKGYINLKGTMVAAGSIKAIVPHQSDPDTTVKKQEFTEMVFEENRQFRAWRRERLALPPKERAKSVSFMNYMSQALRGRPLTEGERAEVREKQEEFFKAHPDFHTASPTCYFKKEDIITRDEGLPMVSIKTMMKLQALKLAELHLNAS